MQALYELAVHMNHFKRTDIENSKEEFLNRLQPIFAYNSMSTKYRNVFGHRDLWLKNVMFKFEIDPLTKETDYSKPIHAILLDFQLCRYYPPANDVLQLIYLTTRRSDRNEHFDSYLLWYHHCLTEELHFHGIDSAQVLSLQEFQNSCKELQLLAITTAAIYLPLSYLPHDLLPQLKITDPDKYHCIQNVKRTDFIVDQMENNEEYKEIVLEIMNELLDTIY